MKGFLRSNTAERKKNVYSMDRFFQSPTVVHRTCPRRTQYSSNCTPASSHPAYTLYHKKTKSGRAKCLLLLSDADHKKTTVGLHFHGARKLFAPRDDFSVHRSSKI